MTILAIILSSLALLAATADLVLTLWERKRSKERNTALMQYADTSASEALAKASQNTGASIGELEEKCSTRFEELKKRIADLEKGIVPDFEKAKAAANAVNDFNAGISGILGFDPHEVLKKQRNDSSGGDWT
jgi:hypothetical protein